MSAFTYSQSASAISANSLAFASPNTSGNVIVAMVAGYNRTLASGVADTQGNTYTKAADAGTLLNGRFQVWIATGIASGANTLSFTGMDTSNTNIIIAEYSVPTAFHIGVSPLFSESIGAGALSFSFPATVFGSPTFPSEVMLIATAYDWAQYRTWAASSGTIRQTTSEADGATTVLADFDVVSPGAVVSTTLTAAGGGGDDFVGAAVQLFTVPSGGGGGGGTIFAADMSGGFSN